MFSHHLVEQKDLYKHRLEESLSNIVVPHCLHECKNLKCKNRDHCDSVDELAIEVLETVQLTAESILTCPFSGGAGSRPTGAAGKAVPGWSARVKPYRETAYFWHQVWLSCGKPINNEVHKIMKRTKNIYHYEIRKVKKAKDTIKKNKLLDACLNNGGDLFKEIKAMRRRPQPVANSIDGVTDS